VVDEGFTAVLQPIPSSQFFQPGTFSSASTLHTVAIRNIGNGAAYGLTQGIVGSGLFVILDSSCPGVLQPAQSCDIRIYYHGYTGVWPMPPVLGDATVIWDASNATQVTTFLDGTP
jgi:hypothetical protein